MPGPYADNVVPIALMREKRALTNGIEAKAPYLDAADRQIWAGRATGFRALDWIVYPRMGEVTAPGICRHLEPMVMDVLVILAERSGDVVARAELLDRVWGARSGTSDESLTRCISVLRKTFDDSTRDPGLIRTIFKRGYVFIPTVSLL